jgi:hypothetical protein
MPPSLIHPLPPFPLRPPPRGIMWPLITKREGDWWAPRRAAPPPLHQPARLHRQLAAVLPEAAGPPPLPAWPSSALSHPP